MLWILFGCLISAAMALPAVAENAPGVKAVNDHLAWVDGLSGVVVYPSNEESVQAKVS